MTTGEDGVVGPELSGPGGRENGSDGPTGGAGGGPSRPPFGVAEWIMDHNPLYLLSATLMLLGCYLISSAMDLRAGEVSKLLTVLGTLNAYEFLVIGLGLFLWRKRGVARDGMILLMLEALFLADLTFLNSEAAAADLWLGLGVNGALLVLTLVKVGLVTWGMPLERSVRTVGFVVACVVMLCGLPVLLKAISVDGLVGALPFYALWWVVGILPAAYEAACWWDARRGAARETVHERNAVRLAWTVLPWVSLVAHLGFQHWVYRGPFHAADLVPVAVGLIVAARRIFGAYAAPARLALVAITLGLGLTNPAALGLHVPGTDAVVSPLLTSVTALAVVIAGLSGAAALAWTIAVMTCLGLLRLYGPSWEVVWDLIVRVWRAVVWAMTWAFEHIVPTTAAGWGAVAVGGAFVALGAGAAVSLKRGTDRPATG